MKINKLTNLAALLLSIILVSLITESNAQVPTDYKGQPFADEVYKFGAQVIPGTVECAYYDLGGEGVAFHDSDSINSGSGGLNLYEAHHRPQSTAYFWAFRKDESMDVSYTKDFADFNHANNLFTPFWNQLYIGWTGDNEWINYTVDVKAAGKYKIVALYSNEPNTIKFSINNQPACECKLPLATGSYHIWNKAEIGTINFENSGIQLLTFHYNKGNNFAYFEFIRIPAM